MSYEIEVNLPNRPKGDKVAITGLGVFPNGKTSPVDDERAHLYQIEHEVRDEDGKVVVSGALGSQNWPEGIKVHVVKKDEDKPSAPVAAADKPKVENQKSEGSDK
jgi:hypothetical protein